MSSSHESRWTSQRHVCMSVCMNEYECARGSRRETRLLFTVNLEFDTDECVVRSFVIVVWSFVCDKSCVLTGYSIGKNDKIPQPSSPIFPFT